MEMGVSMAIDNSLIPIGEVYALSCNVIAALVQSFCQPVYPYQSVAHHGRTLSIQAEDRSRLVWPHYLD